MSAAEASSPPPSDLRAYLEGGLSNLVDAEWSEYNLRTIVRKLPKVSIGEAKAWAVAETRGTALTLTVKYTPPGEHRGDNLGSSTFHPRPGGEGGYGTKVFLASKMFRYVLEKVQAQNLANTEQWQIWFEQAKMVLNDILQARQT